MWDSRIFPTEYSSTGERVRGCVYVNIKSIPTGAAGRIIPLPHSHTLIDTLLYVLDEKLILLTNGKAWSRRSLEYIYSFLIQKKKVKIKQSTSSLIVVTKIDKSHSQLVNSSIKTEIHVYLLINIK